MPRQPLGPLGLTLVGIAFTLLCADASRADDRGSPGRPLYFERNAGQAEPSVRFLAHAPGLSLVLADDGATVAMRGGHSEDDAVRIEFVGRNRRARPRPEGPLAGRVNYLAGRDPARWLRNVETFERVTYPEVYPGIDVTYHGREGRLEYDLRLAPGQEAAAIRIRFPGTRSLRLSPDGGLRLALAGGEVAQDAPVAYQDVDGERRPVAARYALLDRDEVGFVLGPRDSRFPVVIDPVFGYSTYLGGNGEDYAYAIAVDGAGNAYVTGNTNWPDFPLAGGVQGQNRGIDAFVTKLGASGSELVYSTFLGGSCNDYGWGIAVDAAGAAYVVGQTCSADFPTASAFQAERAGQEESFLSKLSAAGDTLEYSTYLGGQGSDKAYAVAVDPTGRAFVAGETTSTDFPVQSPFQGQNPDGGTAFGATAFVTAFSATGTSLAFSTYLGGSAWDSAEAITLDGLGRVVVGGRTHSADFPVTAGSLQTAYHPGDSDGFVAAFTAASGTLAYSTFLGGTDSDVVAALAADGAGRVVAAGSTSSVDFPSQGPLPGSGNAFVARLAPGGNALEYVTRLPASVATAVALDGTGRAYVGGVQPEPGFPTPGGPQPTGSADDGFVATLSAAGEAVLFGTYLGGSDVDGVEGLALGPDGAAYVTGWTYSLDFPTRDAFQSRAACCAIIGGDAFVTKLTPLADHTLVLDDATVVERCSSSVDAVFWVHLSPASAQAVEVHFASADASATAPADYAAAAGSVTFAPGATDLPIVIQVQGDAEREPTERFHVNLSSPVGATLGDAIGVGSIRDGSDAPSNLVVYRAGAWLGFDPATGAPNGGVFTGQPAPGCIPAPLDLDGDGLLELSQLCGNRWNFYASDGSLLRSLETGGAGQDIPVPADYDGDGKDEVALFRAGAWHFFEPLSGVLTRSVWTGLPPPASGDPDVPYPADFDGDGRADLSIFAGGAWHFYLPSGAYQKGIWTGSIPGDVPVAGDYDGDGIEDVVVFRDGAWLRFDNTSGDYDAAGSVFTGAPSHFTGGTPLPAPLDVDGDSRLERTVWSGGPWHLYAPDGGYDHGVWCGAVAGDLPVSRRGLQP